MRFPVGTPAPIPRGMPNLASAPAARPPKLPIALVRVDGATVIVARVLPWVLHDPFERELILTALELSYRRQIALFMKEPCGCQAFFGAPALVDKLQALPPESFQWRMMRVSFAGR